MAKILLVEDEPDFSILIAQLLASEHHTVEIATSGESALELLAVYHFDCLILDWNLPGISGLEVCQKFRAKKGLTPILMLTARQHVDDKSAGLDSGADDYLTKPFELKELSSRVRALLRRPTSFQGTSLKVGKLEMDVNNFKLTNHGKEVQLLPKEFALLEFFMRHPNQVFSPETLIDRVWASDHEASPETIRTYIKRLRKKLDVEGKPSNLSTVHGVGYKFDPQMDLTAG
ncbi:MAG: response regulator transcription factor [Candidatus Melainabacteria bacterium]|jgi:two-component system OmpR family response regulator|nr:response regulator transcription factor [Candidatus Melainabacteria bacterium]